MKVITATEKNNNQKYDIMVGTGLIFDYQNKKMFHCTDDAEEAEWSDQIFTFEIEGEEVIFYLIEALSYDVVKDMAEVIRIQEMENDLDYIKSQGEHGYDCSDCDYKQSGIEFEPCRSCVEYCNHSKNKKDKSYNEVVTDFVPPVDGQQCPSWVNPTTWNAMQNVQRSINDFFANVSNLKTLNTKTGCLEPMTFESLKNAITKPDFEPKILSSIAESGHKTLTTEAREHAKVIIDYCWNKAREKFEYDFKIVWCYDLNMWTEWCENYIMTHDNLEVGEDPVNHIFYHLMKLKQLYNL